MSWHDDKPNSSLSVMLLVMPLLTAVCREKTHSGSCGRLSFPINSLLTTLAVVR